MLGKTEIWIEKIRLKHANLNKIASTFASILGLQENEVSVTDVGEDYIVLDVLQESVQAEQIYGKKRELIRSLSNMPEVLVTEETDIHSEGILSFISLDENLAEDVIETTARIVDEIKGKITKRAIVFPTGFEVKGGMIEDTNTPMIAEMLGKEGYDVKRGPVLDDDESVIASAIDEAVNDGYGLILTTGGVGAEAKDKTIEGVQKIDKDVAISYVLKYRIGTGRHVKDGVRIAVGKSGISTIIALPGPNDEVKIALNTIIPNLSKEIKKSELAEKIAGSLKRKFTKSRRTIEKCR